MTTAKLIGLGLLMAVLGGVAGCGDKPAATTPDDDDGGGNEHTHGTGPHGGTIFDLGKYHAEFTVDHAKKEVTLYILGDDEKTAVPVKAENLELTIDDPDMTITLKAMPLDGETGGKSSRYVGTDDLLAKEQEFEGEVIGKLDGKPSSGKFAEEAHDDGD